MNFPVLKKKTARTSAIALAVLALSVPLLVATAGDPEPEQGDNLEQTQGVVEASIIRTFAKERLLEVKIEHIPQPNSPLNSMQEGPKRDGLRIGQIMFVSADAKVRIFDPKGAEKTRHDKDAWIVTDDGWALLTTGQLIQIDYSGSREAASPAAFPEEARARAKLYVHLATMIQVINKVSAEELITSSPGSAKGAIVRVLKQEKLLEFQVETATIDSRQRSVAASAPRPAEKTLPAEKTSPAEEAPPAEAKTADKSKLGSSNPATPADLPAPAAGSLILLCLDDALVYDEKGTLRKRDDEAAWFSSDDGWSILKSGQRLKITFSGAQRVFTPKDFPDGVRTSGKVLVYNVSTLRVVPE